jgi:predicted DNA binding CopG/RHH family protein
MQEIDNMKYSDEELEILQDIEDDKYISVSQEELAKHKEKAKVYAQNTLKQITKKKAYTIKLMGHDVDNIKSMAIKKGLPYQTFISSILHQVATKQIKV